jgi:uncharacterized protein YlxW (UPF0749 family)
MFLRKNLALIGVVGFILGFVIIQQFYLHEKITKNIQPESENNLALEVSELIKTNDELTKEVNDLTDQHGKLSRAAADASSANATLEENLNQYEIILGLTQVQGQGVEIIFNDKISSTQLVDVMNAIKNIGADAIQINDRRIIQNSSITEGFFYPPVSVKVIGNKDLLYEALVRPGGILDQIGLSKEVVKSDNVNIDKK